MAKYGRPFPLVSILLFLFFSPLFASAYEREEVTLLRVFDGDTIEVRRPSGETRTVRYLLIDTPELHHPQRGEEELGKEAFQLNQSLLSGHRVFLEFDREHRDKYGRLLAHVFAQGEGDPFLVSEALVRHGYALPFILPPNERYAPSIRRAFVDAAASGAGFWGVAADRLFTDRQIWTELPYLAGRFVTLDLRVDRIVGQKSRFLVFPEHERLCVVVYRNSAPESLISSWKGKRLRLCGKVTRGRKWAEIMIHDPHQVLFVDNLSPQR